MSWAALKEELKIHSQIAHPTGEINPNKISTILDEGLRTVSQQLIEQARHENQDITKIAEHVLRSSGKRVRSRFVLVSHLILNHQLSESAIDIAMAAELFHSATLLHDDVMDDAFLRRGKETVNSIWGPRTAVLLGDFFLSRTFRLLQKTGSMEVIRMFIDTAQHLGEGALTEQLHKDNLETSEETYDYIINRKTASFFGLCASIGAFISGADEKSVENLREFGLNFGMAFQITDDIMDLVSDETTMGKPRGKDILEGHLTLPLISFFKDNRGYIPNTKLSQLSQNDAEFIRLLNGINSDGSLNYSYERASGFTDLALKSLSYLPRNDATRIFKQMTLNLLKRKK